jgi:DNA-binding SARP family transcriptional activator
VEFRVLGPLEVREGMRSVPLGGAKPRALLGVLLLHANEVVSLAGLVESLWGEHPPATAGKLVQGYVHALRKQLGADTLLTRPPGYRLDVAPGALDLLEFRRLTGEARQAEPERAAELRRAALALWQGPPLADVQLEGPAANEVGRLAELRLTTQIEQIDAELALGRHADLVGELETLVAANPYQERLRAQLILALFRSGRQAEALQAYRAVRRSLRDELGLEPGDDLRRLEAAILRQDPALALEIRAEAAAAPAPAGAEPAPPATMPDGDASRRGRLALAAAAALAVLVAAAVAVVATTRDSGGGLGRVRPNSVGVIDAASGTIVAEVPVGRRPGPVAVGGGSVWVGNLDDRNLTRIDARRRAVSATVDLDGRTPTALAYGAGALWVAHGARAQLSRVDAQFGRLSATIRATALPTSSAGAGVAVGAGSVWAVYGESTVVRVDPSRAAVVGRATAASRRPRARRSAPARSGSSTRTTPPSIASTRRPSRRGPWRG